MYIKKKKDFIPLGNKSHEKSWFHRTDFVQCPVNIVNVPDLRYTQPEALQYAAATGL